jgi:glutamine amidotransferase PdxT
MRVFIRAPVVEQLRAPRLHRLPTAWWPSSSGNLLGTSFHPGDDGDTRFHE